MRDNVSTTNPLAFSGPVSRLRVIPGGKVVPTLPDVRERPVIDMTVGETERRDRLVYWVNRRMRDVGITSVRQLADEMGAPASNVDRWLGRDGTGKVEMVWLPELCKALRVDPVWFMVLPAVPADPLAPYALPEDDPLLVALGAARSARRDVEAAEEGDPPAEATPRGRPRRRARQGGR